MEKSATITVTSGPDRGKVFELIEELVHVGRGPQNQVALNDAGMADHQASIVSRDGRYAIFTPLEKVVEVDGAVIPSKRWVWLPTRARIRISDQTAFQFNCPNGHAASATTAPQKSTVKQSSSKKRATGKATKKNDRHVARFITDRAGDALVTLGEDGQLPELSLVEGPERKTVEKGAQQSNPLIVYGVVAFSFCMSLAMIFVDGEPSTSLANRRGRARMEIKRYYQPQKGELEPYQRALREAQLAHSRSATAAERAAYRQVLSLLSAEDKNRFTGLTGTPEDDEKLRELISLLLSR